jgi:DNA-directed RNA polymerase II subunit RPB9
MLYPKEDPDTHRLQFACRTCQYSEEATSSCVFRNVLNNAVGETAGVTQDVGSDPTVGLPLCLLCGSMVICEGRVEKGAAVDDMHQGKKLAKM